MRCRKMAAICVSNWCTDSDPAMQTYTLLRPISHLLWVLCLLAVLACVPARSQSVPENDMKTAFIYNFILFTEWPAESIADSGTLPVCINSASSLRPALSAIQDKIVKGRRLTVTLLDTLDIGARQCGVLFVDSLDVRQWTGLRKSLATLPVLTIGNEGELGLERTMVTLSQSNRKIVFDIDMAAVRQSGLAMSSKLLRLARIVQ